MNFWTLAVLGEGEKQIKSVKFPKKSIQPIKKINILLQQHVC